LALQPPRDVNDLTPNQRTFKTITWRQPAGYFYPSYNLYYSSNADPTVRSITGIRALQYVLDFASNQFIIPGNVFTIQITGVSYDGRESPKSAPLIITKASTAPADPKINPALGITNINCAVNANAQLTCNWLNGPRTYKVINVRIKCPKGFPGAPRIRRKFIRGGLATSFTTSLYKSGGQVCKVFFHALYVESTKPPYPRFGRKYKAIRVTVPNVVGTF
jgi:hypothetical protein